MTFWQIEAKAGDHAEVMIYDVVGESMWEESTDAKTFVKNLNALKANTIDLRLNSPGGSVFDGNTIYNALVRHPAQITTYVDGLAASIASIIALAGDKIVMAKNAMMMIHNPSSGAWGGSDDLRKAADMLDKLAANMIEQYAERTGQTPEDIAAACDAETWFTAQEAVDWGLADSISSKTTTASAQFSAKALNTFRHVPPAAAALLAPPRSAPRRPSENPTQEASMKPELAAMRDALNLGADATEDEVRAAAQEALDGAEGEETPETPEEPEAPVEQPVEKPETPETKPEALTRTVDAKAFAASQAELAELRKERLARQATARGETVAKAAREGRISRSQRAAYRRQLDLGGDVEASTLVLLTAKPEDGGLEPGLVPVGELGALGEDGNADGNEGANPTAYEPGLFPEAQATKARIAATNGTPLRVQMEV